MRSSNSGAVLVLVLFLVTALPIESSARTWIVAQDGTGDFSSVAAACEAASAGDSVLIRAGEYREEGFDNPTGSYIYLSQKPLSILGGGPAETVSLQMKFGISESYGVVMANVWLHDVQGAALTTWGGSFEIRACRFENNVGDNYGGAAILSIGGALLIEDCVFKRNHAPLRGWGWGWGGEGGAIWGGAGAHPAALHLPG